ncbi:hypothetical protein [Pseudomonas brassicacearum]|uniref:hypothetical protein n=1 Tax=Pseudomonas brassicacearum TaxID=930166 RepID=UPI0018693097|nr:hypothetical protein [Pseudomonas brassicacearum]QOD67328.1 hypothetical protein GFU70_28715 [Pseudomonas brassicacearum]
MAGIAQAEIENFLDGIDVAGAITISQYLGSRGGKGIVDPVTLVLIQVELIGIGAQVPAATAADQTIANLLGRCVVVDRILVFNT